MILFVSFQESFLIILIALILFGPKKIPEIARTLGNAIRELREASNKIKQEIWEASENEISKAKDSTKKIHTELKDVKKVVDSSFKGPIKRG